MILIVEDNKALRLMTGKALEKEGYSVKTASDGKEALSIMEKETPELIISDIVMPEMDGFEFLEKVRENDILTPIIMLTVKSELKDYSRGYALGASDYITKPFEMNFLIRRVEKKLSSYGLIREITKGEIDEVSLDKVNIIDLLHIIKSEGIDSTITIESNSGEGMIETKNGKILKTEFNDIKDKDALLKIAGLKEGIIRITRE